VPCYQIFPFVDVAAKTGTAQIGVLRNEVNSLLGSGLLAIAGAMHSPIAMERGSKPTNSLRFSLCRIS